MLAPWKKSCDQPRQHIKKQRHYFGNKGPSSQGYGFSSDQVWMWELKYKESWMPKNWCFWTVVLEKTLESPLAGRRSNQSILKEIRKQFIGRTDVEAEIPILWPPDGNNWLIWEEPDAGKDWGWEEKGMTEDEMVGWHHWLSGHGFGWTLGVGDGQRGLACCGSWGRKSQTRVSNWTKRAHTIFLLSSIDLESAQLRVVWGSPELLLCIFANNVGYQYPCEKKDEPWKISAAGVVKWSLSEKEI